MNSTSGTSLSCTVSGEAKLPPQIGGEQAVCAAIGRELAPALQQAGIAPSAVSVSVKVLSDSRISAVATIDGKTLPDQNVATSDRTLNKGAIDMLARGLAAQLLQSRR